MATNAVPLPGVSMGLHCSVLSMKSPEEASHLGYPQCTCTWPQSRVKLPLSSLASVIRGGLLEVEVCLLGTFPGSLCL